MTSAEAAGRVAPRRHLSALAASLTLGLVTAVAVVPGWTAAASPGTSPVAVVSDPVEEPGGDTPTEEPTGPGDPTTAPSTIEPPSETTPPPPVTTEPAPPTTSAPAATPTTTAPSAVPTTTTRPPLPPDRPPVRPTAPGNAPAPPLGVRVTTGDVTVPARYWNSASIVTTLQVTVTNTGRVAERIRLSYTLPPGLTDAGTAGCAEQGGGSYRCGEWTADAGARFSTVVRVRVAGTAWRQMPLSGSVAVTASAPGTTGPVSDHEGFAVLFPPGPPAPGIALETGEVAFDISGEAPDLAVRLGNTGTVDASGGIEVVLPAGVTVPVPPAGCAAVDATRTRCDVGTVPAGETAELWLPVEATPEAQRQAPLSGAVVGSLDQRSGQSRQVQMSFRITAAAALATPVATGAAPTGSQGVLTDGTAVASGGGGGSVRRTAILLIAVSTLLVVLALGLATTSLRRRLTGPVHEPAAAPRD
ncbi:hypothetical protein ACFOOK_24785 [Micromonospora krabiensis]|uniref:Uncharacterized protein n=1 Tax=Micromonospora krabiensis TaxID=307121 RepID=A0A1C3N6M2_9ACTN|nr:hypothetical protein [Micromonospora krabiensis]SBV28221.1 hypothetical protein GA0070620_3755 [Micromonospora krabiensis]